MESLSFAVRLGLLCLIGGVLLACAEKRDVLNTAFASAMLILLLVDSWARGPWK